MKVLVLLAEGFETMEFSVFIDIFGWARNDYRLQVETVTCGFEKVVYSTFKVPVIADKCISELQLDEYDALAVPGGFEEFGFYEEAYSPAFLSIIQDFERKGKPIASICVGALPLGKSGILKNRKATTYHLKEGIRQKQLKEFCNEVAEDQPIVLDKNVITSFCPETAPEVAFLLLELLTSKEEANLVRSGMGYQI